MRQQWRGGDLQAVNRCRIPQSHYQLVYSIRLCSISSSEQLVSGETVSFFMQINDWQFSCQAPWCAWATVSLNCSLSGQILFMQTSFMYIWIDCSMHVQRRLHSACFRSWQELSIFTCSNGVFYYFSQFSCWTMSQTSVCVHRVWNLFTACNSNMMKLASTCMWGGDSHFSFNSYAKFQHLWWGL